MRLEQYVGKEVYIINKGSSKSAQIVGDVLQKRGSHFVLGTTNIDVTQREVFVDKAKAQKYVDKMTNAYKAFKREPYMHYDELSAHFEELQKIEKELSEKLSYDPNFDGIDFCNVHAGGTQIRLHHKEIQGYTIGHQVTILEDYSNINKVAELAVQAYKVATEPMALQNYKNFLDYGEKWGWD